MRTRTIAAAVTGAALFALVGCSGESDGKADGGSAAKASPTPSIDVDAIRESVGLPPEPKGPQRAAFLAGLNAIDQDIVHGKDDKAVSRGIDTCGAIKNFAGDKAKQVDMTNKRWSSPTHPEGHGLATAEKILDVAHKNICPDF